MLQKVSITWLKTLADKENFHMMLHFQIKKKLIFQFLQCHRGLLFLDISIYKYVNRCIGMYITCTYDQDLLPKLFLNIPWNTKCCSSLWINLAKKFHCVKCLSHIVTVFHSLNVQIYVAHNYSLSDVEFIIFWILAGF